MQRLELGRRLASAPGDQHDEAGPRGQQLGRSFEEVALTLLVLLAADIDDHLGVVRQSQQTPGGAPSRR